MSSSEKNGGATQYTPPVAPWGPLRVEQLEAASLLPTGGEAALHTSAQFSSARNAAATQAPIDLGDESSGDEVGDCPAERCVVAVHVSLAAGAADVCGMAEEETARAAASVNAPLSASASVCATAVAPAGVCASSGEDNPPVVSKAASAETEPLETADRECDGGRRGDSGWAAMAATASRAHSTSDTSNAESRNLTPGAPPGQRRRFVNSCSSSSSSQSADVESVASYSSSSPPAAAVVTPLRGASLTAAGASATGTVRTALEEDSGGGDGSGVSWVSVDGGSAPVSASSRTDGAASVGAKRPSAAEDALMPTLGDGAEVAFIRHAAPCGAPVQPAGAPPAAAASSPPPAPPALDPAQIGGTNANLPHAAVTPLPPSPAGPSTEVMSSGVAGDAKVRGTDVATGQAGSAELSSSSQGAKDAGHVAMVVDEDPEVEMEIDAESLASNDASEDSDSDDGARANATLYFRFNRAGLRVNVAMDAALRESELSAPSASGRKLDLAGRETCFEERGTEQAREVTSGGADGALAGAAAAAAAAGTAGADAGAAAGVTCDKIRRCLIVDFEDACRGRYPPEAVGASVDKFTDALGTSAEALQHHSASLFGPGGDGDRRKGAAGPGAGAGGAPGAGGGAPAAAVLGSEDRLSAVITDILHRINRQGVLADPRRIFRRGAGARGGNFFEEDADFFDDSEAIEQLGADSDSDAGAGGRSDAETASEASEEGSDAAGASGFAFNKKLLAVGYRDASNFALDREPARDDAPLLDEAELYSDAGDDDEGGGADDGGESDSSVSVLSDAAEADTCAGRAVGPVVDPRCVVRPAVWRRLWPPPERKGLRPGAGGSGPAGAAGGAESHRAPAAAVAALTSASAAGGGAADAVDSLLVDNLSRTFFPEFERCVARLGDSRGLLVTRQHARSELARLAAQLAAAVHPELLPLEFVRRHAEAEAARRAGAGADGTEACGWRRADRARAAKRCARLTERSLLPLECPHGALLALIFRRACGAAGEDDFPRWFETCVVLHNQVVYNELEARIARCVLKKSPLFRSQNSFFLRRLATQVAEFAQAAAAAKKAARQAASASGAAAAEGAAAVAEAGNGGAAGSAGCGGIPEDATKSALFPVAAELLNWAIIYNCRKRELRRLASDDDDGWPESWAGNHATYISERLNLAIIARRCSAAVAAKVEAGALTAEAAFRAAPPDAGARTAQKRIYAPSKFVEAVLRKFKAHFNRSAGLYEHCRGGRRPAPPLPLPTFVEPCAGLRAPGGGTAPATAGGRATANGAATASATGDATAKHPAAGSGNFATSASGAAANAGGGCGVTGTHSAGVPGAASGISNGSDSAGQITFPAPGGPLAGKALGAHARSARSATSTPARPAAGLRSWAVGAGGGGAAAAAAGSGGPGSLDALLQPALAAAPPPNAAFSEAAASAAALHQPAATAGAGSGAASKAADERKRQRDAAAAAASARAPDRTPPLAGPEKRRRQGDGRGPLPPPPPVMPLAPRARQQAEGQPASALANEPAGAAAGGAAGAAAGGAALRFSFPHNLHSAGAGPAAVAAPPGAAAAVFSAGFAIPPGGPRYDPLRHPMQLFLQQELQKLSWLSLDVRRQPLSPRQDGCAVKAALPPPLQLPPTRFSHGGLGMWRGPTAAPQPPLLAAAPAHAAPGAASQAAPSAAAVPLPLQPDALPQRVLSPAPTAAPAPPSVHIHCPTYNNAAEAAESAAATAALPPTRFFLAATAGRPP